MDSARTDTLNDFIARARQKVARLSIEPGTVLLKRDDLFVKLGCRPLGPCQTLLGRDP